MVSIIKYYDWSSNEFSAHKLLQVWWKYGLMNMKVLKMKSLSIKRESEVNWNLSQGFILHSNNETVVLKFYRNVILSLSSHFEGVRVELPIKEWNALSGTLICIVYISFFFVMFYGYKWSKLRNYVIKDINIKTFMHMWNYLFKYLTLLSIFSFYTFFKGSIVTNIV